MKIRSISKIPFNANNENNEEIIEKIVEMIMKSLEDVIKDLKLENNARIKNGIPKVLAGKIKGKLHEMKDHAKILDIIFDIQDEAFNLLIENDKVIRDEKGYYDMR